MIQVAFVSNYFTHHQSSLSDALYHRKGTVYHFIETMPMEAERKNMGWNMGQMPPYVLSAYESDAARAQCMKVLYDADIAIVGQAPDQYIAPRHREGRFVFRYSERFLRNGCPRWQIPLRFAKNYWRFGRFRNDYLLCASAYTAADAAITRSYVGKAYRWGYFPETKRYDVQALLAQKRADPAVSILWVGRFLELKHPDHALAAAERLKARGIPFRLRFIGSGETEDALRRAIREKGLSDRVELLGTMTPAEVRAHMERADIFLFTSDFREGWGAVLNESMNSACAVVASHAIGSVPFLIRDGENGFIYRNGDLPQLVRIVETLARDRALREKVGAAAYESIVNEWSAECAAERMIALYEELRVKGVSTLYTDGPCSPAPILQNEWYHHD